MGRFYGINQFNAMMAIGLVLAIQQKAPLAEGTCDIYAAGGTPCVAAFSTVRVLLSAYKGPLYQVRRTSDGKTKNIMPLTPEGVADGASQDAFLGAEDGTISKLYDQTGNSNDLIKGPAGCSTGSTPTPDNESNAKGRTLMVGGHKVYALSMIAHDGYRNNTPTGLATDSEAEGIYEIADGKVIGQACCWDFGNASTDNCNGGTGNMGALFFGTGFWGKGEGSGPWFLADFDGGVWAGGAGNSNDVNSANPSMGVDYAVGMLKTNDTNYAIRVGDGQSGNLTTAYDGATPASLKWTKHGGIVLGIGGDNSNSSQGTFFEGAITSGRPTDETDEAVLKNIQAAGYGSAVVSNGRGRSNALTPQPFSIQYTSSSNKAVINYTLAGSRRLTLKVFDSKGNQVAVLADGILAAGSHHAIWDAKRVQAGVYIATLAVERYGSRSEKIFVGKK